MRGKKEEEEEIISTIIMIHMIIMHNDITLHKIQEWRNGVKGRQERGTQNERKRQKETENRIFMSFSLSTLLTLSLLLSLFYCLNGSRGDRRKVFKNERSGNKKNIMFFSKRLLFQRVNYDI